MEDGGARKKKSVRKKVSGKRRGEMENLLTETSRFLARVRQTLGEEQALEAGVLISRLEAVASGSSRDGSRERAPPPLPNIQLKTRKGNNAPPPLPSSNIRNKCPAGEGETKRTAPPMPLGATRSTPKGTSGQCSDAGDCNGFEKPQEKSEVIPKDKTSRHPPPKKPVTNPNHPMTFSVSETEDESDKGREDPAIQGPKEIIKRMKQEEEERVKEEEQRLRQLELKKAEEEQRREEVARLRQEEMKRQEEMRREQERQFQMQQREQEKQSRKEESVPGQNNFNFGAPLAEFEDSDDSFAYSAGENNQEEGRMPPKEEEEYLLEEEDNLQKNDETYIQDDVEEETTYLEQEEEVSEKPTSLNSKLLNLKSPSSSLPKPCQVVDRSEPPPPPKGKKPNSVKPTMPPNSGDTTTKKKAFSPYRKVMTGTDEIQKPSEVFVDEERWNKAGLDKKPVFKSKISQNQTKYQTQPRTKGNLAEKVTEEAQYDSMEDKIPGQGERGGENSENGAKSQIPPDRTSFTAENMEEDDMYDTVVPLPAAASAKLEKKVDLDVPGIPGGLITTAEVFFISQLIHKNQSVIKLNEIEISKN